MHRAKWVLAVLANAILSTTAWGLGGDGLTAKADQLMWARWQGRLALGTSPPQWQANLGGDVSTGLKINSVSLFGDYYFSRPVFGARGVGGFRTTGGLIHGPRAQLAVGGGSAGGLGSPFSIERRWLSTGESPAGEAPTEAATLPYLGLGYTGLSHKSGWSFNADLGLVALYPGHVVKFGRVVNGAQPLDEVLRDMRLAPILQFGVSYSF